jgi:hypothetical protein
MSDPRAALPPSLIAGNENFTAGNQKFIAGNENLTAGNQKFIAATENFIAGNQNLIAGNQKFIAGNENFIAGNQNLIAGNENPIGRQKAPFDPKTGGKAAEITNIRGFIPSAEAEFLTPARRSAGAAGNEK